jgi:hypothetical protein
MRIRTTAAAAAEAVASMEAAAAAAAAATTTVVFFVNCGDILLCPLPIWYQLFNHKPFRRSVGLLVQEISSLQALNLTAYRNTKTRT